MNNSVSLKVVVLEQLPRRYRCFIISVDRIENGCKKETRL